MEAIPTPGYKGGMQLLQMAKQCKNPALGDENWRLLVLSREEACKVVKELIGALAGEPGGGYDAHMVTDDDGKGLYRLTILLDQKSTWPR